MPSRAACAETLLARLPVDAQARTLNPSSTAGRRDRDDAVLVGERRMVDRIVLDVELAEAEPLGETVAAHERREAGVEAGERFAGDREQLPIPPQILRAPFDLVACDVHGGVVVDRLERAEALVADVDRLSRKPGVTQMTLEPDERVRGWPRGGCQRFLISPSRLAKAGIGT